MLTDEQLDILQKTLDDLHANPSRHDQATYFMSGAVLISPNAPGRSVMQVDCKTAYCLAGDALINNGYTFVAIPGRFGLAGYPEPTGAFSVEHVIHTDDVGTYLNGGHVYPQHAHDAARELLGLTYGQADHLFAGTNTRLQLWALAYCITAGRIALPDTSVGSFDGLNLEEIRNVPDAVCEYLRWGDYGDGFREVINPDLTAAQWDDLLNDLSDMAVERARELAASAQATKVTYSAEA
jgi:hypothetical protein